MVIYKDVPARITHKCWHIHKIGGVLHRNFTKDYGDVPVANYNEITGKFEAVVNNRGNAYATRNRMKFKRKEK